MQHQCSVPSVGAAQCSEQTQLRCKIATCYLAIIVCDMQHPRLLDQLPSNASNKSAVMASEGLSVFFIDGKEDAWLGSTLQPPPVLDRERLLVHATLGNYSDPADPEHVLTLAVRRHGCV